MNAMLTRDFSTKSQSHWHWGACCVNCHIIVGEPCEHHHHHHHHRHWALSSFVTSSSGQMKVLSWMRGDKGEWAISFTQTASTWMGNRNRKTGWRRRHQRSPPIANRFRRGQPRVVCAFVCVCVCVCSSKNSLSFLYHSSCLYSFCILYLHVRAVCV